MNQAATGILAAAQQHVRLPPGCEDVREVRLNAPRAVYLLERVVLPAAWLNPAIQAMPSVYSVIGDRLYVYPTPDKDYTIDILFENGQSVKIGFQPAWRAQYDEAFAAAQRGA